MFPSHKNLLRIFMSGVCFFVMLGAFDAAWAGGNLLYRFKVPVFLINIPASVKYARVRWTINDQKTNEVFSDELVISLDEAKDKKGNYIDSIKIEIFDSDFDDLSKPSVCVITLKLSKDGDFFYFPNTPGKAWTQSQPGTKTQKVVTIIKLQETPEESISG